jgi:two-component system, cell cycle response regulator DivK
MTVRLLLVEDNPVNAKLMVRRLERSGYEVIVAEDGETAIALAHSEQLQLILMDISLPGINGWEATQLLRGDPMTAVLPIIALTAHDDPEIRQRCLAMGFNDYATKPVDFEQLLAKIQQWIRRSPSYGGA